MVQLLRAKKDKAHTPDTVHVGVVISTQFSSKIVKDHVFCGSFGGPDITRFESLTEKFYL